MPYLVLITALWAFSFSLIGVYLAGQVDAWFSVLLRVALASCVFLPFIFKVKLPRTRIYQLMAIGAVQLGVMYGFYYHSFLYLSVPEVLLFTVMTPLYISILNDLLDKRFNWHNLLVAILAVFGAVAIRYQGVDGEFLFGLALVQGANLCFAIGQVSYKRVMTNRTLAHHTVFGWFFVGALMIAGLCYVLFGNSSQLPTTTMQWSVLIYLGLIASGLGYFGWNYGATKVDVGTLAVMNNLLIPAGIFVNLLIWNREADILRLSLGTGIIVFALVLNHFLNRRR